MSPDQIITNVTELFRALLPGLGGLAAVAGTALFATGKATDSPNIVRWGKNSWVGALIAFSGAAVIGLLQYLSGRIFA